MARPRKANLLRDIAVLREELHRSNKEILKFFKRSKKPLHKTVTTLNGVKSLVRRAKKYGYITCTKKG